MWVSSSASLQLGGTALQGSSLLVCWSGDKTHSLAETEWCWAELGSPVLLVSVS